MAKRRLSDLIQKTGSVVIDGAMSTALEALGCDLNDSLWSAKILAEAPEKIRQVHSDYFAAGANVAITASYQATEAGFAAKGIGREEAALLIRRSVSLALEAKAEYLEAHPQAEEGSLLVAGSVGPYGAYLANGAEYTGAYGLTEAEYRRFHELRLKSLAEAGADLFAIETQPKAAEVRAILGMLADFGIGAWVTFTLKDSAHIADGTPVEEAAALCEENPFVEAAGFNCVKRELVSEALRRMRSATGKPLIVYPNSGETYDPATKTWRHPVSGPGWGHFIGEWGKLGAVCLGGCCRTLPRDISEIASLLKDWKR